MRFIHTGDWHLGRLFHNLHLTTDQRYTLEGLVHLAREEAVDAVVVAGDVFDRAVPPTEAVELLDDVLAELTLSLKIPVIMIAGNHDSPARLEYLSGLVRRVGLHVIGAVSAEPQSVVITGRDGHKTVFWPLAYTDPETARAVLDRTDIHTHQAVLEAQLEGIRERMKEIDEADPATRHVLIAHAFVTGSQTSESERPLTVGGTGEVPAELFDGFDYVALGHLHRPQTVAGTDGRVRYAGSLLKYSFDEADHTKSVTLVELADGRAPAIETVELPTRHDLVRLKGTFHELMNNPDAPRLRDAYIEVTLTDTDAILDPMDKLRTVYPNILSLRREAYARELAESERRVARGRSTLELFREFFEDMTGEPLPESYERELRAVLDEIQRAEREVAS